MRLQIKQIYAQFIFPVQFKYLKERILQCLENGTDTGLMRDVLLDTFTYFIGEQSTFLLFVLALTSVDSLNHRIIDI